MTRRSMILIVASIGSIARFHTAAQAADCNGTLKSRYFDQAGEVIEQSSDFTVCMLCPNPENPPGAGNKSPYNEKGPDTGGNWTTWNVPALGPDHCAHFGGG